MFNIINVLASDGFITVHAVKKIKVRLFDIHIDPVYLIFVPHPVNSKIKTMHFY